MVGDFNISSIVIDKAGRQKIGKILGDLNNAMKACVCAESLQACLTLYHMDCSPLGSFVYEILQARILAWVAIPFFRGSSRSRDRSQVSSIAGGFFTI